MSSGLNGKSAASSSSASLPPTSRFNPPFLFARVEVSQYTSVYCSTILHQPLLPSSGAIRFPKMARSARKPFPYSREVELRMGVETTLSSRATDIASQRIGEDNDDAMSPLLIPKPTGENGRRNRGGYSVREQVRYRLDIWREIEVRLTYLHDNPCALSLISVSRNLSKNNPTSNSTSPGPGSLKKNLRLSESKKK